MCVWCSSVRSVGMFAHVRVGFYQIPSPCVLCGEALRRDERCLRGKMREGEQRVRVLYVLRVPV